MVCVVIQDKDIIAFGVGKLVTIEFQEDKGGKRRVTDVESDWSCCILILMKLFCVSFEDGRTVF
jgi:hypothetical protein